VQQGLKHCLAPVLKALPMRLLAISQRQTSAR